MLAVLFCGCAHGSRRPPCVSSCGMLLEDESNGAMSCKDLQKAEDEMLTRANDKCKEDGRMCKKYACGQLFGWQLRLGKEEITVLINDGEMPIIATGYSRCSSKEMWLGSANNWRSGSYPHEFFHAIQECNTKWSPSPGGEDSLGSGHDGWTSHGIYEIIKDVRSR